MIASDTGANPELVKNGENGLLFELADINSLADKMQHMIENRNELDVMGKKAREYAMNGFSLDRLIDDIENVYAKALLNNNRQ